jgi:type II secretory pathway component PulM
MIKNGWHNRDKREKIMLCLMAACLFFFVFFELFNTKTKSSSKQLIFQQQRSQLLTAVRLEKQIAALYQAGAHIKQPATPALIEQSLNTHGFQQAIEKTDLRKKTMAITFKAVPFDDLMTWLTALTESYTVHITRFSAHRLFRRGLVSATIQLTT